MASEVPCILIVDDDAQLRQLLQRLLLASDWKLLMARSGEEAMAFLTQRGVDLIITDLRLPGMDGIELARRAKETPSAPDVILMTGAPSLESAIAALKTGLSDYLLKPFQPESFHFVLERWRRDWEFKRSLTQAQSALAGALDDVFGSVEKLLSSLPPGQERDRAAQVLSRSRDLSKIMDGMRLPPRRRGSLP